MTVDRNNNDGTKKRLLISPWGNTYQFIHEQAKELGCLPVSYAAHVLNQHYLESLKNND